MVRGLGTHKPYEGARSCFHFNPCIRYLKKSGVFSKIADSFKKRGIAFSFWHFVVPGALVVISSNVHRDF